MAEFTVGDDTLARLWSGCIHLAVQSISPDQSRVTKIQIEQFVSKTLCRSTAGGALSLHTFVSFFLGRR